ncbi:MAG: PhzF family phenazine biosynthesis protein [Saprospiraceae bacterium]
MDALQTIEVQILNAFVDNNQGGNPAGVVLNADALTNEQKLKIAAAVGLSETAFVSKSKIADFKLDFFTPNRQIAHCGHATIATFSYLAQLDKIPAAETSKETIDGIRRITVNNGLAFMEQTAPKYTEVTDLQTKILSSLGLSERDLLPDAPILKVNTGNSFLLIPVTDTNILAQINPKQEQITQISDQLDLIGYYVFTPNTDDITRDATTRMFAPRYDIPEEAGTGMAAGPLACYLYDILKLRKKQFLLQQGKFMSPPSISLIQVNLEIEADKITGLMAGGKGIASSKMTVQIDNLDN